MGAQAIAGVLPYIFLILVFGYFMPRTSRNLGILQAFQKPAYKT